MPRLLVPSDDLHLVPGITKTGVEAVSGDAVVARLASLEKQHEQMMTMMQGMQQSHRVTIVLPVPLQLRLEMDKAGWMMMMLEAEEGNLQIWVAMMWN